MIFVVCHLPSSNCRRTSSSHPQRQQRRDGHARSLPRLLFVALCELFDEAALCGAQVMNVAARQRRHEFGVALDVEEHRPLRIIEQMSTGLPTGERMQRDWPILLRSVVAHMDHLPQECQNKHARAEAFAQWVHPRAPAHPRRAGWAAGERQPLQQLGHQRHVQAERLHAVGVRPVERAAAEVRSEAQRPVA